MYAVICDPDDRAALWAVDRLRIRLDAVRLIPIDLLALTRDFRLSLGADEGEEAAITLPGGFEFGPAACAGLLNRVGRFPRAALSRADARYAAEEMAAITLAFLSTFGGRAVNQPDPSAPAGRDFGPEGWLHLAALAGLPAAPFALGDGPAVPLPTVATEMLVIGTRALGGPAGYAARAVDLARMAGLQIMGLRIASDGTVAGATSFPDLSIAGEAGAEALAELLQGLE